MSSHCIFSIIKCSVSSAVKLYPPTNLTVQNGSDFNLWFYWNQTSPGCVESEVRFRTNNVNKWEVGDLKEQKRDSLFSSSFLFFILFHYLFCLSFHAHLLSLLHFIFHRLLKSVSRCRVTASTCHLAVPSMSCKWEAKWRTTVQSLYSGVTGVSLWSGEPTTAQVKLHKEIITI